jgi:phosphoglycolate phosphatase-like HAD superfamily hydrolase
VLVLIDIDGTLLIGAPLAHTAALAAAAEDVYGVPVAAEDIRAIGPAGRTDREIARLVLGRAGLADEVVVAGLDRWVARASDIYPAFEPGFPPPRRAPGAPEALARLRAAGASLALLTGNLEPIAHAKMAAAGLGGWFARGRGAFGSDHERRDALVPIALSREAGSPEVVVVGDTPRDIACARAGGARCVALTTGPHDAAALAAADAVVGGLPGVAEVICGWSVRPDQSPIARVTRS